MTTRSTDAMDVTLMNGMLVRTAGPQAGKALIFLHAFADSSYVFTPLFNTPLADRFRLFAVDLAGFGSSPRQDSVRTIADHAESVAGLVRSLPVLGSVGLVAHSVTSMIAVQAALHLGERFGGVFSIEGNLTAEDAYFSGRAGEFNDPHAFKQWLLEHIWTMAQTHVVMRRFFASAVVADPIAMWELGCDARRLSIGDAAGQAFQRVRPSLYYWSPESTMPTTARWIAQSHLEQRQFSGASHWPMVDQPEVTAQAISAFFEWLGSRQCEGDE